MNNLSHRYTGSAMIECIALMALLLPIGFGITMFGKLIDLRQTTEQASRFAIWQSTVASRESLSETGASLINRRFYSAESDSENSDNQLWRANDLPVGRGMRSPSRVQIERDDAVVTDYTFDLPAASVASGLVGQVDAMSTTLGGFSGNTWDINGNGLLRAQVDVGVQANPGLPGTNASCSSTDSGACVQSAAVIMSDGWSARSDDIARQRIQSFMPARALQPVGNAIADVGGFLLFPELRNLKNAFGHVDMSVLPEYAER